MQGASTKIRTDIGEGRMSKLKHSCHVWWTRPFSFNDTIQSWMSPVEAEIYTSKRTEALRNQFASGVMLMRLCLAQYIQLPAEGILIDRSCPVCGKNHGKPRLVHRNQDIQFSLTHTRDLIAFTVTTGVQVGIDIESLSSTKIAFPSRHDFMNWEELLTLGEQQREVDALTVLRFWTRKESAAKALGVGLMLDLRDIHLHDTCANGYFRGYVRERSSYHDFSVCDLSDRNCHVGAISFIGSPRNIVDLDGSILIDGALNSAIVK